MGRRAKAEIEFDRDLRDLPAPLRRREFMMRIEAVIFASGEPVKREVLASIIGDDCNLDELLSLIGREIANRPFEIARVAGGFQYRTRLGYGAVIRAASAGLSKQVKLSPMEQLALTAIAYFQPVTRIEIGDIMGKPISRDIIAALRSAGLVSTGPRSPKPGAPFTYVTTDAFLVHLGLNSLRDLPDIDRLEEAGLLGKAPLPGELRMALGLADDTDEEGREEEEEDETDEADAIAVAE
jgi:segregation and condensation protein B